MRRRQRATVVAVAALTAMGLTSCAGWGGGGIGGGGPNTINVLMVNNPQMIDLQRLTAEHFTAETGISVNFTVLPENDVRDKISQEFSSQAGQYDVASLSNFEIPIYAGAGWVAPMDDFIAADPDFDQDDILGPMQTSLSYEDHIYGQPFYGESSFLMYRKDLTDELGLDVPERPTWPEVRELAKALDGAEPGMAGICLRGQPGWGQIFAPLTTVVNTFGGTWFTEDWQAQVDAPEFTEAVNFYVDLVNDYGPSGAPQAGYTECLNNLTQGNVAMWYDSTAAAGTLEADGSPVQGKIGYVAAPVVETESSGWLYSWSWGIQAASEKQDAAWQFVSWASGKEYEELVGEEIGWASVPAGKRASTYDNPQYLEVASAFAEPTKSAIEAADPTNPGVQPRPAIGIQFVGIPEFPDLGTQVSQDVSSAIAGRMSVEDALERGQDLASDVAERYLARKAAE
ncbi:ABC transporter substrate-binding protein [Ornithinicoccus hortensis]|uniref:Carbohydrate ABC transporter substrate-binding protein (CUT1 family) n=1 Tax=Ornithinicoccus hortensis TaxID=82346 RepID=A0A542YMG6_9MICO|nr:sugar ABC transporter substrate-binding protein [Ornithinicoccus hortensis]TQL49273.1 carbohydrate ABC transporter substrate-binding protein (CUT1 family) [Ornithinicoccus hortensis]